MPRCVGRPVRGPGRPKVIVFELSVRWTRLKPCVRSPASPSRGVVPSYLDYRHDRERAGVTPPILRRFRWTAALAPAAGVPARALRLDFFPSRRREPSSTGTHLIPAAAREGVRRAVSGVWRWRESSASIRQRRRLTAASCPVWPIDPSGLDRGRSHNPQVPTIPDAVYRAVDFLPVSALRAAPSCDRAPDLVRRAGPTQPRPSGSPGSNLQRRSARAARILLARGARSGTGAWPWAKGQGAASSRDSLTREGPLLPSMGRRPSWGAFRVPEPAASRGDPRWFPPSSRRAGAFLCC